MNIYFCISQIQKHTHTQRTKATDSFAHPYNHIVVLEGHNPEVLCIPKQKREQVEIKVEELSAWKVRKAGRIAALEL